MTASGSLSFLLFYYSTPFLSNAPNDFTNMRSSRLHRRRLCPRGQSRKPGAGHASRSASVDHHFGVEAHGQDRLARGSDSVCYVSVGVFGPVSHSYICPLCCAQVANWFGWFAESISVMPPLWGWKRTWISKREPNIIPRWLFSSSRISSLRFRPISCSRNSSRIFGVRFLLPSLKNDLWLIPVSNSVVLHVWFWPRHDLSGLGVQLGWFDDHSMVLRCSRIAPCCIARCTNSSAGVFETGLFPGCTLWLWSLLDVPEAR